MSVTIQRTLYAFSELSEDAQETAIEQWRKGKSDSWDSHDVEYVTDFDYWQDEKLAPFGVTVGMRQWTNSYGHSGSTAEVYFSCFTQGSSVDFPFSVDVPQFMRASKLAKRYRSLYHAALHGDVCANEKTSHYGGGDTRYSVELEYTGERDDIGGHWIDGERWEDGRYKTYGHWCHGPWYAKLNEQMLAVQDEITSFIDDVRHDWLNAIENAILYQSSDENIREELTHYYTEERFSEDGELVW